MNETETTNPPTSMQIASPIKPKQTFTRVAISDFNPVRTAEVLLPPTSRHWGWRDVLFSGFTAWVVCPTDEKIRMAAMRAKARSIYYRNCERLALQDKLSKKKTTRSLVSVDTLYEFKREVYDALGGHSKMIDENGKLTLSIKLTEASRRIEYVLRLAQVWHYMVATGIAEKPGDLTKDAGFDFVSEIGVIGERGKKEYVTTRTVQLYCEPLILSIAFSYAASTINIPRRGTILDLIRDCELTLKQAQPFLQKWFGRAKFVNNKILSLLYKPKEIQFPNISDLKVTPAPFEPMHLSRAAQKTIEAFFK